MTLVVEISVMMLAAPSIPRPLCSEKVYPSSLTKDVAVLPTKPQVDSEVQTPGNPLCLKLGTPYLLHTSITVSSSLST
ncbi:hypothetical protein AX774_g6081 [Zancudomyces culisetae]|uniref:Uncharacterized protein n=1 Tax=Zancudomyces culisetae TaxID=1213189 RepID=A0A1R1PHP4_ZANCU|nr:hypothetical protein AX774_g6081 [Zancudomyces culisetae]|eukprot:OMH80486.1 hypothetical protein AX774_g6081 [Zancudomyces culisetae]